MKDLPDLALLARTGVLDQHQVRTAIEHTFAVQATHPVPPSLPDPPTEWATRYTRFAAEEDLHWKTLDELLQRVREFLDEVLRVRSSLIAITETGTS
jgi:hypothetical protein